VSTFGHYLDVDILVWAPLTEVSQLLRQGVDIVLTPHILAPAQITLESEADQMFLQFGAFNAAFLAVATGKSAASFLH